MPAYQEFVDVGAKSHPNNVDRSIAYGTAGFRTE